MGSYEGYEVHVSIGTGLFSLSKAELKLLTEDFNHNSCINYDIWAIKANSSIFKDFVDPPPIGGSGFNPEELKDIIEFVLMLPFWKAMLDIVVENSFWETVKFLALKITNALYEKKKKSNEVAVVYLQIIQESNPDRTISTQINSTLTQEQVFELMKASILEIKPSSAALAQSQLTEATDLQTMKSNDL